MSAERGRASLGVVVIGRNEGERLRRCLRSLRERADVIAYVDSGSSDGSVAFARSLGVDVVELDLSRPFTAARARNAGFEQALAARPDLAWVQFVDGDCEIADGWLERARRELESAPDVAIVCGRRRERFPEASVYNLLCDLEWSTPVGEADFCGGDFLVRVQAFRDAGGFDPGFIAGEEPELCLRLRGRGWRILRVDAEMTAHDVDLTRFSQWWTRAKRAGYAMAQTAWTHRSRSGRIGIQPLLSNALWAVALPLLALGASGPSRGLGLALLAAYPVQWWRIARARRRSGSSASASRWYALFVLLGKFAQVTGAVRFARLRLLRRSAEIIEYKGPPGEAPKGG